MAEFDMHRSDHQLLSALTSGSSVRDAASAAGMSERTAYRRLQDPDFRARLTDARRQVVASAVERMTVTFVDAIDELHRLVRSEQESTRLRAVKLVMDYVHRFQQQSELHSRIDELERQYADDRR